MKLSPSSASAGEHRQNKMSAPSDGRVQMSVTPTSPQPTEMEQKAPDHADEPGSSRQSSSCTSEHQAAGLPVAAASAQVQSSEPGCTGDGAQDDKHD